MDLKDSLVQNILSVMKSGSTTGYGLIRALKEIPGCELPEFEGGIYPVLHTLEKYNILRSRIGDTDFGFERRFYHLTGKGKRMAKNLPALSCRIACVHQLPNLYDMSMRIIRLRRWSMDAVMGVSVSPKRELIAQELYDHVYDLFCEFLNQGMDGDTAEKAACEAMGSYRDLARELSPIHSSFWPKSIRFTQWFIVVLAFMSVICYGFYFLDNHFIHNTVVEFDSEAPPAFSGTHILLWENKPHATQNSDGYFIRASRTALWQTTSLDDVTKDILNIQLRIFHPLPWAEAPDFCDFLWAEDSLGNVYLSAAYDTPANEPSIQATQYHVGRMTYVQDLWMLNYVSDQAQWIELHYDRSGREITLRLTLPGGDT